MAINLNAIRSLLRPGLDVVFGDYATIPTQWKELFEQKKSDMAYEVDIEFQKFGLARSRNEGEATSYDETSEGPQFVYRHVGFSNGFIVTKYALEDNLYKSQFNPNAEDLKRSMAQTKEVVGASVLNNATDSNYLGGDGVSLLSTAHPLGNGATLANTPSTQAELNETSLGEGGVTIRRFKDRAGLRVMARARKLVVTPENQYVAERLLRTSQRVGTSDNDVNAVRDVLGLTYVVNDFITNTKAWFLLTDVKNGLKMYQRTPIEVTMQTDFDTDSLKTKAHERYSMGWSNFRGLYGSMP
jgi:hypothetical protein